MVEVERKNILQTTKQLLVLNSHYPNDKAYPKHIRESQTNLPLNHSSDNLYPKLVQDPTDYVK